MIDFMLAWWWFMWYTIRMPKLENILPLICAVSVTAYAAWLVWLWRRANAVGRARVLRRLKG